MADATLYDQSIPICRTQMIPSGTDEISGTWCREVARQQVRAAGYAGSFIMDIPPTGNTYTIQTPWVGLPQVYGTLIPPAIFGMPQYGSVIIYKQFEKDQVAGYSNYFFPAFRTWVHVRLATVSVGTWELSVLHYVKNTRNAADTAGYAYVEYYQWLPAVHDDDPLTNGSSSFNGNIDEPRPEKVILHWLALGADPNL